MFIDKDETVVFVSVDGASDLVSIASQSIDYKYDAHHQRIVFAA